MNETMIWNTDTGEYRYVDESISLEEELLEWAANTSHYRCGYEVRAIVEKHAND